MEERLGHRFRHPEILDQALVHASYVSEHLEASDNERLEFLGDSVLQLAVTDYLYRHFSDLAEGELAKIRAASVSRVQLAAVARSLDLGRHLALGRGEDTTGGRDKDSILADAMEAVLGAVYLDAGYGTARRVVMRQWKQRIEEAGSQPGVRDFKTRLQELMAKRGMRPRYRMTSEGLDHEKTFTATVEIDGAELGTGVGRSKKQAEQLAARATLRQLERDGHAGAP